MKKYLYVYFDNTSVGNVKEVVHSVPFWKLKDKTLYKEADGRNFLSIYKIDYLSDFYDCYGEFIQTICLN